MLLKPLSLSPSPLRTLHLLLSSKLPVSWWLEAERLPPDLPVHVQVSVPPGERHGPRHHEDNQVSLTLLSLLTAAVQLKSAGPSPACPRLLGVLKLQRSVPHAAFARPRGAPVTVSSTCTAPLGPETPRQRVISHAHNTRQPGLHPTGRG